MTESIVWRLVSDEFQLEQGIKDAEENHLRALKRTEVARRADGLIYAELERLRGRLAGTTEAIEVLAKRDGLSNEALANWRKIARGEKEVNHGK